MTNPRISFHFPREASAELAAIMANTRLDSPVATVRVALSAYKELLEITRAGCKIIVRNKAGIEYPYSLFAPFDYPGFANRISHKPAGRLIAPPRNLFFSSKAVDELVSIRKQSFAQNNADAIRIALASFSELVRVLANGDEIIVRDRRGNEVSHDPRAPLVRDGLDLGPPSGPVEMAPLPDSGEPARPPRTNASAAPELII
jgi:hypothetical protein